MIFTFYIFIGLRKVYRHKCVQVYWSILKFHYPTALFYHVLSISMILKTDYKYNIYSNNTSSHVNSKTNMLTKILYIVKVMKLYSDLNTYYVTQTAEANLTTYISEVETYFDWLTITRFISQRIRVTYLLSV